jgi:hypothetical protein
MRWAGPAVALAGLFLAAPADAQMTRVSTLPPIATVLEGEAIVGLGVSQSIRQRFPLSGLEGDLLVLGRLTAAYALADRAVVRLDWDALRVLNIDGTSPSAVTLDEGVDDGRTSDAGDARIELMYAPLTLASRIALGGWVAMELANTNETRGIGTNTNNAYLGAVVSAPVNRLSLTGRIGVGILESPLNNFSQDDVIVYAVDAIVQASDGLRLLGSIEGASNPRRTVSLGLEDTSLATLGVEAGSGAWRLDAFVSRGFATRSPDWLAGVGFSWRPQAGY